jgi:hypothetical protein
MFKINCQLTYFQTFQRCFFLFAINFKRMHPNLELETLNLELLSNNCIRPLQP